MAEEIKGNIENALAKAQEEHRIDIFEFGDIFRRKYKGQWALLQEQWDEEFSNAAVNVNVRANIRRSGLTTKI
ncbi:hypothetical protein N752_04020 [Desulforamulus aquiferis]|nr:hypothetical protein N752_04020 [Desulforamulus aquiferis]